MYALLDCNNYYVSCERAFNPRLEGIPVGVLSSNDGCIVARSDEMKALGVEMGTPRHLLPKHIQQQSVFLSSNYCLYGDMARRITEILRMMTAHVEVYSIDESFCSLIGYPTDTLETHCRNIRETIYQWTGIRVSVGIASSKVLAKVATRAAKKQPWRDGVCQLETDSEETRQLLMKQATNDLWGIAHRTASKLELMGIKNAYDLRQADPKLIRSKLGVVNERIIWELRGYSAIQIEDMDHPRQRIMVSRSFGRTTGIQADVAEAVRVYTSRAAEKLRRQKSVASALLVFIRTNSFHTSSPQYSNRIVVPLEPATDDTLALNAAAQRGLQSIYRRGFGYQKAGVMLMDLQSKQHRQLALGEQSDYVEDAKRERLMGVMDKLNATMGKGTIKIGLPRSNGASQAKVNHRSPRYTTHWNELPIIKAK